MSLWVCIEYLLIFNQGQHLVNPIFIFWSQHYKYNIWPILVCYYLWTIFLDEGDKLKCTCATRSVMDYVALPIWHSSFKHSRIPHIGPSHNYVYLSYMNIINVCVRFSSLSMPIFGNLSFLSLYHSYGMKIFSKGHIVSSYLGLLHSVSRQSLVFLPCV